MAGGGLILATALELLAIKEDQKHFRVEPKKHSPAHFHQSWNL
jgi:hypothetical protein